METRMAGVKAPGSRWLATEIRGNRLEYVEYAYHGEIGVSAKDVSSEQSEIGELARRAFFVTDPSSAASVSAALRSLIGNETRVPTTDANVRLRFRWFGSIGSGKSTLVRQMSRSTQANQQMLDIYPKGWAEVVDETLDLFGTEVAAVHVIHRDPKDGRQLMSLLKNRELSSEKSEKTIRELEIWVLTFAPSRDGVRAVSGPNAIDDEYVGRQREALNISIGMLGLPIPITPVGIISCITKSDQVSALPPPNEMVDMLETRFGSLRQAIDDAASTIGIRVEGVTTSALKGWGINAFRMAVAKIIRQGK
jgi:hypothetical protein